MIILFIAEVILFVTGGVLLFIAGQKSREMKGRHLYLLIILGWVLLQAGSTVDRVEGITKTYKKVLDSPNPYEKQYIYKENPLTGDFVVIDSVYVKTKTEN